MKKKHLFALAATALTTAMFSATFNTNAQSQLFICPIPQNSDLTLAGFEALDFEIPIVGIGNFGDRGLQTNLETYPTWDTKVDKQAKGSSSAGAPTLEVLTNEGDAGYKILMLAAGVENNNNYAIKELRNTGDVRYWRGVVAGFMYGGGQNNAADTTTFTIGLNQEPVVKPASGSTAGAERPELEVSPAITGTAEVGETLTVDNGTFTGTAPISYLYQWFAAGQSIAGATANTYVLTAAEVGKVMTCRVTAINNAGSAFGMADQTVPVVA